MSNFPAPTLSQCTPKNHGCSCCETILARFDMTNCKPQYTPMVSDIVLTKLSVTAPKHAKIPYQQAISMLLYLAQATQLDIAYAVNYLCRFAAGFDESHWLA